jgi:hypothetical protein
VHAKAAINLTTTPGLTISTSTTASTTTSTTATDTANNQDHRPKGQEKGGKGKGKGGKKGLDDDYDEDAYQGFEEEGLKDIEWLCCPQPNGACTIARHDTDRQGT